MTLVHETREPEPEPGCGTCAELNVRRVRLWLEHDYSGVTDCNVLIRRHPHVESE